MLLFFGPTYGPLVKSHLQYDRYFFLSHLLTQTGWSVYTLKSHSCLLFMSPWIVSMFYLYHCFSGIVESELFTCQNFLVFFLGLFSGFFCVTLFPIIWHSLVLFFLAVFAFNRIYFKHHTYYYWDMINSSVSFHACSHYPVPSNISCGILLLEC